MSLWSSRQCVDSVDETPEFKSLAKSFNKRNLKNIFLFASVFSQSVAKVEKYLPHD